MWKKTHPSRNQASVLRNSLKPNKPWIRKSTNLIHLLWLSLTLTKSSHPLITFLFSPYIAFTASSSFSYFTSPSNLDRPNSSTRILQEANSPWEEKRDWSVLWRLVISWSYLVVTLVLGWQWVFSLLYCQAITSLSKDHCLSFNDQF